LTSWVLQAGAICRDYLETFLRLLSKHTERNQQQMKTVRLLLTVQFSRCEQAKRDSVTEAALEINKADFLCTVFSSPKQNHL
jgi:hypothetical protein